LSLDRPIAAKRLRHAPGDPLEGFNRKMFAVQDGLDRALIRPVAIGYRHVVPKPVRGGLRHFISNLTEPIVFLNYLLQFKPGKAAETLARFAVNSTIGVGGVIDVAKLPSIGLPHRPNGFGDTLGFYGVKAGPYLYLPLIGPSDLRDFLGGQADNLTIPVLAAGKPFNQPAYLVPSAVIGGLDQREQNDDDLRALYAGAIDPYASLRSVYLQDRKAEIAALHHRPSEDSIGSPLDDTLEDPDRKANTPESVSKTSLPVGPVGPHQRPVAPPSVPAELEDPLVDPATPPQS
jgi:phospholipid-binding lipoprotein MlaA